MKYIAALLALAASAAAQTITACGGKAQACLDDATKSSGICSVGDWACGCSNMEAIQGGATTCVISACGGTTGALEVLSQVQAICANPPAPAGAPAEPAPPAEESGAAPAAEGSSAAPAAPTTLATSAHGTAAPAPTGGYSGPIVNGAGAAGPIVGMVLGAAALVL